MVSSFPTALALSDTAVRQFDIVENLNPTTRRRFPLVIVLQHDRVSAFSAVVVAPLTDATPALVSTRLHPQILVADRRLVAIVEELTAVTRSRRWFSRG